MALAHTAVLAASSSEGAHLAVLVNRLADPVDPGIAADGLVSRVDEDDLKVLVCGVLSNPVRVEDTEATASAAGALLGNAALAALELEVVHTLVGGLAADGTLGNLALATTTPHAGAVHNVTLLGLVGGGGQAKRKGEKEGLKIEEKEKGIV